MRVPCPLLMLWTAPAPRHRNAIVVALEARTTKEVKPLSIWKVDTMADRVASHYSENLKLADAIAEKLRSAVGFKLIVPSR